MEKAGGNMDSGTLEHFTNYTYAPTRATPLSVFALTNGNLAVAANGFHQNVNGGFIKSLNIPSASIMMAAQRPAYSTESEMTSMTSLSNQSARGTPPNLNNQDTTQLPQAEE